MTSWQSSIQWVDHEKASTMMSTMKAILSALLCVGLLSGVVTGCSNPGLAMREPVSNFEQGKIRSSDRIRDRERYIDKSYQTQLDSGRAKNEEEARALAGLEWERVQHRSDSQTTQSTTWSSRDTAERKQQQLESELEEMDLE